jgi:uncharacterized protein YndB with AHSA1/START domain
VNVARSRTVAAPLEVVWQVAGDPRALPRWWPRTERVEGVSEAGWTSVLRSARGRAVRADYRVEASEPPRRRAWAQRIEGTPFEPVLAESRCEVRLAPAAEGTEVVLEARQRARRWGRLGGFLLRRALRRQLDEALAGLAEVLE